MESTILSFGAERIVIHNMIHNTSKVLLEIKFSTQCQVIHVRLSSKDLHMSCSTFLWNPHGHYRYSAIGLTCSFTFIFPHPRMPSIAQCSHNLIIKAIGNRTPADSISSDCSGLYKSQASLPLWSKKLTHKHQVMAVHHCWQLLTFPGTAASDKLHYSLIFAFL